MEVTAAVRESAVSSRGRSSASERAASPKCDLKELRSVLRAVRKATSGDGRALWLPVRPGGPTRYDHFNKVLFDGSGNVFGGLTLTENVPEDGNLVP